MEEVIEIRKTKGRPSLYQKDKEHNGYYTLSDGLRGIYTQACTLSRDLELGCIWSIDTTEDMSKLTLPAEFLE